MVIRFDGQVAVITGAGGGLGRSYALELGKRGAKVVVNDIGGDVHGTSKGHRMADSVVNEIKATGGVAVANYDSVENGDKIIETAIKSFGRIDILINNAGILRDKTFGNMKDTDYKTVLNVHLMGAYHCSKAAWPYMKKQKYGRLVFTSSNSGVYGSFGQTNYSSAKAALIGLGQSLALEGKKYNILSNIIIPTAGSRMTETLMPKVMLDQFDPKHVAPMVSFLASKECKETGKTFQAGAGYYGEVHFMVTKGVVNTMADTEYIHQNLGKIQDSKGAIRFKEAKDLTNACVSALQNIKSHI